MRDPPGHNANKTSYSCRIRTPGVEQISRARIGIGGISDGGVADLSIGDFLNRFI